MTGDFKRYSIFEGINIFFFILSDWNWAFIYNNSFSHWNIDDIVGHFIFISLSQDAVWKNGPHCSNNMTFWEKQKRLCKKCKTVVEVNII